MVTVCRFVKVVIDTKRDSCNAVYYNNRVGEFDQVVRKIDTLPPVIERALCELILLSVQLKREDDFYRNEIKKQDDFNLTGLFKVMAFDYAEEAAKKITGDDVLRFFTLNKLLI